MHLNSWFVSPRTLSNSGVVGLNSRNGDIILPFNARINYPLVDDKVQTKRIALQAGLPVPPLYGVIESVSQIKNFARIVAPYRQFVIKPACGSAGSGIIVIKDRIGDQYQKSNGTLLSESTIQNHLQNAVSGAFSLGGRPDSVLIEYCVQNTALFDTISSNGVPDVRVIVLMGIPIMAMVRLPTKVSDGRANLHQGAIGVGIDIESGKTLNGVWFNDVVYEHPDTHRTVRGLQIPAWDEVLTMSSQSYELTGLGYIGADIVFDRDRGPLLLELNARPGLNIQIANQAGLRPRIDRALRARRTLSSTAQRVQFAKDSFGTTAS